MEIELMKSTKITIILIMSLTFLCIVMCSSKVEAGLIIPSSSAGGAATTTAPSGTTRANTTAPTTKAPTQTNGNLPVTGIEETSWMIVVGVLLIVSGIYAYRKMGDYKGI
jgi:LPXTG-motif cell wall-anchored protein